MRPGDGIRGVGARRGPAAAPMRRAWRGLGCLIVLALAALNVPILAPGTAWAADPPRLKSRRLAWEGIVPPKPTRAARPLRRPLRALVPFQSAPFPYAGTVPDTGKPFLDVTEGARAGHRSARTGRVHWQDEIYADNRALLVLPAGYDVNKRTLIVLFLHGNGATLERDVEVRQRVPEQLARSGLNAVLVAPQLAIDAPDSSPGRFWEAGHLARFLDEAGRHLATLHGHPTARRRFAEAPVVLVAYSGGFLPLAWSLHHGGAGRRILGVVVLDGLYGEQAKFATWIGERGRAFFVSAYGTSSSEGNRTLRAALPAGLRVGSALPRSLGRGSVTLFDAGREVVHEDFVTRAWVADPLADLLARIPGFASASQRRQKARKSADVN